MIAGGKGWLYDAIFAEAEKPAVRGRVIFPGFVADADLPALYTAAPVLAYPSIYEGFGLPMLEAMACGTPVVTSTGLLPAGSGRGAPCWSIPPPTWKPIAEAASQTKPGRLAPGTPGARQFGWAHPRSNY